MLKNKTWSPISTNKSFAQQCRLEDHVIYNYGSSIYYATTGKMIHKYIIKPKQKIAQIAQISLYVLAIQKDRR